MRSSGKTRWSKCFHRKRTRRPEKKGTCTIKYTLYCLGNYSSFAESPYDSGFKLYFYYAENNIIGGKWWRGSQIYFMG